MATPLVASAPRCISCIRRMASPGTFFSNPARQQIRGKKKLAKVSTVNVQLLRNVPGYGRKGQVLPITPGVMRNIWYPKRIAGYVTDAKLELLGKKDAALERDPNFGSRKQRVSLKRARTPTSTLLRESAPHTNPTPILEAIHITPPPKPIDVEILSPEGATEILGRILPPTIDFYRTPIIVAPLVPKRISPSIPSGSALSTAAAAAAAERAAKDAASKPGEKISIYGSVSTSDVAANLKAILAEDEEGKRVQLLTDHISFVKENQDKDRVKHLGSFEIDIKLNDSTEVVRRLINVNAQG